MTVLAIETATREGSVAVADATGVLASRAGDRERPHGTRLPGDALEVLAAAGHRLETIDLFAVCLGPGAFTGLRVGIAAAQGLAFALGRPIVGISALEALATAAFERHPETDVVGVWMDAARREVFAARFGRDAAHAPATIVGTAVSAPPDEVIAAWGSSGPSVDRWIGDGAMRYRQHLSSGALVEPVPMLAPLVARLALARRHEAGAPHALRPLYIRPSDAELARQR
jgi:tRNA threonylcarbamoyladenosine biosynthesis protein TsaB